MSALDNIRDAIVAHIQNVPDIGVVHAWRRTANDANTLKALYTVTIDGQSQLRGWHISRISAKETEPVIGRRALTCSWLIQGYLETSDADRSEITFDNLIEAICDTFRDDDTLGGRVTTTVLEDENNSANDRAGIQVSEVTAEVFADVKCHAARLELMTRHYLEITP